jgi:hypothetical protein
MSRNGGPVGIMALFLIFMCVAIFALFSLPFDLSSTQMLILTVIVFAVFMLGGGILLAKK